jgi:hypothetical protein
MMTDDYFSGLFDGEGCVSVTMSKKGCISLSVSVQMCAREPVFALHQRFGGKFVDGKRATSKGSKIYQWTCYNVEAVECLKVFANKCLNKREVSLAGLRIAESMKSNDRKQPLSDVEKNLRLADFNIIIKNNSRGGITTKTPDERIQKFLSPKNFGGVRVELSDGRVFDSMSSAARELGVSAGAIWHGLNAGNPVRGFGIKRT